MVVELDSTELPDGAPPNPALRTRRGRFVLNGETVYPIGVAPIVIRRDSASELRGLIDRVAGLQTISVRFRIRIDTWAFCFREDAVSPWTKTDAGYDLDVFETAFWDPVVEAADHANNRGVLVEFVLFDAQALRSGKDRTGWWRNPFNTICGGPLTPASSARFFHLHNPSDYRVHNSVAAQGKQNSFVRYAVGVLGALPNVTWELVGSLDGADPVRVGFVSHFIEMLREIDPIDRLVSASIATPKRTDAALYRLQGVDTAGFDWVDGATTESSFAETVSALREFGKPVVNHKTAPPADGAATSDLERIRLWEALACGGNSVLFPETVGPAGPPAWLKELIATVDRHGAEAVGTPEISDKNLRLVAGVDSHEYAKGLRNEP